VVIAGVLAIAVIASLLFPRKDVQNKEEVDEGKPSSGASQV